MMRTRSAALLLGPVLVLVAACSDQVVSPNAEAIPAMPEVLYSVVDGVTYEVIELASLGTGSNGHARANALAPSPTGGALVVGAAFDVGNEKAVVWQVSGDGGVAGPVKLGELPEPAEAFEYQLARAINSGGVIVGEAVYRDPETLQLNWNRSIGWVHSDGVMSPLPWFVGDTYAVHAWDVNEHGLAVGWIRYVGERDQDGTATRIDTRGALWLPPYENAPILLDPLEGHTRAHARVINDDGIIAGWSWAESDSVGVYWTTDAVGTIGGPFVLSAGFRAGAMNTTAHAAGVKSGEAAVWSPESGTVGFLGTLPNTAYSQAFGISDAVDGGLGVVGWSGNFTDATDRRPAIWSTTAGGSTSLMELPTPRNYRGGYASDIDYIEDEGWAVGVGFQKLQNKTVWRAILWRPGGDGGETSEPEPCTHPKGKCK
jgi:hypothetical protein